MFACVHAQLFVSMCVLVCVRQSPSYLPSMHLSSQTLAQFSRVMSSVAVHFSEEGTFVKVAVFDILAIVCVIAIQLAILNTK